MQDAPDERKQPNLHRARVPAKEIGRIDVNKILTFERIRFQEIDITRELSDRHDPFDLKSCISNRKYVTLDTQFARLMKQLVLDRLAQIPERSYPAARLMICDHEAYRNLLKLQYVVRRIHPDQALHRFLLQKPPFKMTAIVLLKDIVNLVQKVGRPLALIKDNQTVNYDYSIIKQIFPYLRITDLIVVLGEIGSLRLGTFTMNASKDHQIIQFLTHFARSTHLVELLPIKNKIGGQHQLFSNVSILRVPNFTEMAPHETTGQTQRATSANAHLEPTLLQLSFIAHRLYELINQLEWHLDTITFRVGDPNGFSKIFAQIVHSIEKTESSGSVSGSATTKRDQTLVPVRVLVLDRFFDFQGLLSHTDRYGPYLEQENSPSNNDGLCNLRLDEADHLDELLQCTSLTDALRTILEYGTKDIADVHKNSPQYRAEPQNATRSNQSFKTHSIRRHLDIVKSVYKSLSEGYLLVLKMESSLAQIMKLIHKLELDVTNEVQMHDIVERIRRVATVLDQLLMLPDKSLTAMDMIRVALMLIDLINIILYLYPRSSASFEQLAQIKLSLMARSEFSGTLELEEDQRDINFKHKYKNEPAKHRPINIRDKFEKFDSLSRANCGHTATASLEEIIEQFYLRKLDLGSYPRLKRPSTPPTLAKNVSRNKIIVLVLGSITYDELTRIKSLEATLMQRRRAQDRATSDIVIMCSDIIRPDEFITSL